MSKQILPLSETEFELISLGECMIRLSPPGHQRIELASYTLKLTLAEVSTMYTMHWLGTV